MQRLHQCLRAGQALACAAVLLLAGCATPPAAAPGAERLSGRLSVRVAGQAERSVSGGFELTGTAERGELLLTTPLGTTAARAQWSPGQAELRSGSDAWRFDTLDALATQALGEPVPLAALFDWLRGRPWAGAPSQPSATGQAGFEQLGWQVDLSRWADGWVDARRSAPPEVTVRARIERNPTAE